MKTSLVIATTAMLLLAQKTIGADSSVADQRRALTADLRLQLKNSQARNAKVREQIAAQRELNAELRRQAREQVAILSITSTDSRLDILQSLQDAAKAAREQARKVADEVKNLRASNRRTE